MARLRPDELLAKAFYRWEEQSAEFWTELLRDPIFLKSAWQLMSLGFGAQRRWNALLHDWWQLWGFPNQDDQELLQHRLNQLDLSLDDVLDRLEALADAVDDLDTNDRA